VPAVLIALVLIRLSFRLIQRSHDFLVGTWTGAAGGPRGRDVAGFTQPLRPAEVAKARAFLLRYPGVTAIRELLFTFVGPGRIWIVARVDIDDGLRGAQVTSLARGIESGLKHEAEEVYRVDVVPIGESQALPQPIARKGLAGPLSRAAASPAAVRERSVASLPRCALPT
jgi:divalent metal cation (Fe/Co/Zn/Cd) transporter